MINLFKKQEGFTLLELLIVIVIIGILAVLIVPNLTLGPQRARDAQRKSDLRNVKTALETYFNDNNFYPTGTFAQFGGATCKAGSIAPTYIGQIPVDPKTGTCAAPVYTYTPTLVSGVATKYSLAANLENLSDNSGNGGNPNVYTVNSVN